MLSETSSKGSYYKADVDESVIDVMEGITADLNADVALVFEGEELRGLFTDSDYIKVCVFVCCCNANICQKTWLIRFLCAMSILECAFYPLI